MRKQFENPKGYWEKSGSFTIHLTKSGGAFMAERRPLPEGAEFQGDKIVVASGRVCQTMGGIQFYASRKGTKGEFHLPYDFMRKIARPSRHLIWVNMEFQTRR